jgi:hypothetical protein
MMQKPELMEVTRLTLHTGTTSQLPVHQWHRGHRRSHLADAILIDDSSIIHIGFDSNPCAPGRKKSQAVDH